MVRALFFCSLWGLSSLVLACDTPCREFVARPLDLTCGAAGGFTGEAHFDSVAVFDTFLSQQCLDDPDASTIAGLMASVDFDTEAVFVAVGPRALGSTRCLLDRRADTAAVCTDGLRIVFDDELAPAGAVCPASRWTVALVVPRAELRAALAASE